MDVKSVTNPSLTLLELTGRFDSFAASTVAAAMDKATQTNPANVVVDLTGVDFIDSTGLAVLVQGMKRCRQNRGDLRLCGLRQPVRIIFELTRLDRAMEIFGTRAEAVAAFG